ncbi:AMIN domain-containing protein, partial [Microcoleus sp. herbarium7]|uniref:AMIN domain-containing protein n=1 Tax=Microcoleus sp. herbarium7 TaxID=3055435 RepID=UPI002FD3DEBD
MKLYLPLACVALLSIGIAPSVASQAAIEDLTEASRSSSLAHGSIEIHSESEELPQQESAIATGLQPELPIQVKSLITSQKLETKQTVADDDRQPNPQLTQNISDNDDRSTSVSHSPPIEAQRQVPIAEIPQLREIEQPSTSAQGLLRPSVRSFRGLDDTVQISQSVVQVIGVRLNTIASGLEVILETLDGQVLQATTRIEGKSAIADIENAQLALPSGGEFRASNPDEGIALVTVTQLEGSSRIRVSVTGIKAAPEASV